MIHEISNEPVSAKPRQLVIDNLNVSLNVKENLTKGGEVFFPGEVRNVQIGQNYYTPSAQEQTEADKEKALKHAKFLEAVELAYIAVFYPKV